MAEIVGNDNPLYGRLIEQGFTVIADTVPAGDSAAELRVGLLNLMPDAALRSTERQFARLIAACNVSVRIRIILFSIEGVTRSDDARSYIASYYKQFDQVKRDGLDALIITGAPPLADNVLDEEYAVQLDQVLDWAKDNVMSTWLSCLSAQYVAKKFYDIDRVRLKSKLVGVFPHVVSQKSHPLVRNGNTRFNCIHSRYYDIDAESAEQAGLDILVRCEQSGQFLLAASRDGGKMLFCQGHPEYDTISLFKEYVRDINLFLSGASRDYPSTPVSYFDAKTDQKLYQCKQTILESERKENAQNCAKLNVVEDEIHNTWTGSSKGLFSNWLGMVWKAKNSR